MNETERKMIATKSADEIRQMAAHFRLFAGQRDSKGRLLPIRYAIAADIVAKGLI